MKSASQMSLDIRKRKKAMSDESTRSVEISGEPESAHGELMEDASNSAHEEHAPEVDLVQMLAEGGRVKNDFERGMDERERDQIKAHDKEHGKGDYAKGEMGKAQVWQRKPGDRKARLAKMLSK